MAVLNKKLVPNLYLAAVTAQSHTLVSDIESMREMALFTPSDPESYGYDRFGSLRLPFPYPKSRHVPRSLRIPIVGFVIIIVIFFFVVAFLFVVFFFLVGLLAKEDIGGNQGSKRV
jgi:hypothetical protein